MGFITRIFGFGGSDDEYSQPPPAPEVIAAPKPPELPQAPINTPGATTAEKQVQEAADTESAQVADLLGKRRKIDMERVAKERARNKDQL